MPKETPTQREKKRKTKEGLKPQANRKRAFNPKNEPLSEMNTRN